ncbi:MAG: tRNA pseudouridine(38-40) synthase TruA [Lachnospiraceae bacterium]|nr:tRNA pseudouridine(38-40) synthase TruA [Lachnospiraceae bacterium]
MENYKMIIQYDGTRYSGWQAQKDTPDTIQGKIENVLSYLFEQPIEISGSGRTDAGVHALGQVANFHAPKRDTQEILSYLNAHLPKDIAVLSVSEVDERFHSRLSATGKTYFYRIHTGTVSNVFERKFMYDYPLPLDVNRMKKAASYLIGTHDFKSFCGNKRMKKSTVRTISAIEFEEKPDELIISFTGNGFLMNMVRILTGTLIEIGDGRRDPDSVPEVLHALDRDAAGYTAPPQGLFLKEVYYDK